MSRHRVIIALGSNTSQESNIAQATQSLDDLLDETRHSTALWTDPIGIESDRFVNRLVSGLTTLTPSELEATLKQMERRQGRRPGACTLDADLLLYDDTRYHEKDWNRPYIQQLLKEL